uniref:Arylamine N-acetyltransferase n=1 Tax=Chlamydomonas leiostraca TaxID=1034604 RepID=A0A7S0RDN1_9CHLO
MSLSLEQLIAYLNRIGLDAQHGLPPPTLETLTKLQSNHVHEVSFENLSLLVPSFREQDVTPAGLKLDVPSLFRKVVVRRRGGYCFELNTLFAALLSGLGYTVRTGAARVVLDGVQLESRWDHYTDFSGQKRYLMTTHDHMVLFVSGGALPPGEAYLADVGFGGNTPTHPVLLPPRDFLLAQPPDFGPPPDPTTYAFRVRWGVCGTPRPAVATDIDQGYYLQVWANRGSIGQGHWCDLYYFTLAPYGPMDYTAANFFTSCFPESAFTKGPFCSRPDGMGGRITLFNGQLKHRDSAGVSQARGVGPGGLPVREVLSSTFDIHVAGEPIMGCEL